MGPLSDRGRIRFLLGIMVVVAFATAAISIGLLYQTALVQQRSRLVELVRSQARLIEAVARFDAVYSQTDVPGGATTATLSQVIDAHEKYEGAGETSEFTLARREADNIVFLLGHRQFDFDDPKPVPWESNLAEPMRRALSGQSGTMIGSDYRGVSVMAAHGPVAELDLGIVVKIDMAEIRQPFIRAAGFSGLGVLLIIGLGVIAGRRISTPMIERLRAEEALKVSEAQLRLVVDNLPVLIVYIDADQRFRLVNRNCSAWYGQPAAEILGKRVAEIHGERYALLKPHIDAVLTGETLTFEANVVYPNGERRDIRAVYVPHVERGTVRGYFSMTQDITQSKRAEEALSLTQFCIDHAGEAVFWLGEKGGFEYVNEFGLRMLGYSWDELSKMHIWNVGPDVAQANWPSTWARLKSRGPHTFEDVFLAKDGSKVPVEVSTFHVDFGDRQIVCSFSRDITERMRAEERLRQAKKMEAVGQLTGGIAHDFNNLLAVIQGNAELLEDHVGADDPRVRAVIRAAGRGADLTQRLLAFSRRQPLRPQSIDLAELTTGMSALLKRTLGETIEIVTDQSSDLWPVLADPGQVENALLNLAINARDAMPEGGKLTIECMNVCLDEAHVTQNPEAVVGDYVVMTVSDTGVGMAAEAREHAFEPFFTTKEVGEGSGLGLSMVYGFAIQSGGHATIYSEKGHGTTVKLYLPRAAQALRLRKKAPYGQAPSGRGELVLVVEDDSDVRTLAVRMLEGLGYRVVDAVEAESARAVLGHEQVDLVLCDVVLPRGVSGLEFAETVQRHDPDIKIIFMSGYAAEATKGSGALGSGRVLLNKPFHRRELAKVLREALDH